MTLSLVLLLASLAFAIGLAGMVAWGTLRRGRRKR